MRKRPAPASIDDFGRATGLDLRMSGAFRPDSNALVTTVVGPVERTIDVDGPVRVESDDLPDDLAGVVSKPAWLVEIHLPGGYDETGDRWALDLAIHLARAGDGAVFDPQSDRVVWPSGVTPRKRGGAEERIRTVQLVWYLPASRVGPGAAERWLDLVNEHFPAVAPVRFGSYEPFQGRMDRDGPKRIRGGMAGGGVGRAGAACSSGLPSPPASTGRCHSPTVVRIAGQIGSVAWFGSRRRSTRGRSTVIRRCVTPSSRCSPTVADSLGAVYAGGCVLRDAIMRRGRIGYDMRSESAPMPRARWWVGLPALPTWLAWFGDPYRDLVDTPTRHSHGHVASVRPAAPVWPRTDGRRSAARRRSGAPGRAPWRSGGRARRSIRPLGSR